MPLYDKLEKIFKKRITLGSKLDLVVRSDYYEKKFKLEREHWDLEYALEKLRLYK